jgi:ADP-heptose:LPS heptosyltransferase
LLTDWVPDPEPYSTIRHQVTRDLELVKTIGAKVADECIHISLPEKLDAIVTAKLLASGVQEDKTWIVLHPGVSERKREYPDHLWIAAGKLISESLPCQLLITGSANEKKNCHHICAGIGNHAFDFSGAFSLEEFAALINLSDLVISVNTGTVHLASALQAKTIVLYALTNPQHAPWKTIGKILPFSVPEELQSKNEVLGFIQRKYYQDHDCTVTPEEIFQATIDLLIRKDYQSMPELVRIETRNVLSGNE